MSSKRYYWIKLKDSFLTSEKVDFLMSQPNGAEYVVLYQMLCLKTINNGGELASRIGEIIIPYDIQKIQRDTRHFKVDTIRVALELYKGLGLVYEQESGILRIAEFDSLVGSETGWAKYKRKERLNEKETKLLENVQDKVQQEIRDKSIEYRDKDIKDKDIDKNKEKKNAYAINFFNDFYKIYPKKVNRKKAEQRFETLFKGLKQEKADKLQSEIMQGLNVYISYIKEKGIKPEFILHPTTWLNGERWKDDLKVTEKGEIPDFSRYSV